MLFHHVSCTMENSAVLDGGEYENLCSISILLHSPTSILSEFNVKNKSHFVGSVC